MISVWRKMSNMIINTKKCKIMRITRNFEKKLPLAVEYYIEGQPLESVNEHKDLGFFTTSDLLHGSI